MNRPVYPHPCWVVWRSIANREDTVRYYCGHPKAEFDPEHDGYIDIGFFNLSHVEPFTNEIDAIAKALELSEGKLAWFVDRVDWPIAHQKGQPDYVLTRLRYREW